MMKNSLKQAFKKCTGKINDLSTMAVCFAIGNIPIYYEAFVLNNPTLLSQTGFVATSLAALMVTGSRIYEMYKNTPKEKSSIPHFTLAAFNFAAAGASLLSMTYGFIAPNPITIGMTLAFAGWGTANTMRGIEKREGKELEGLLRPATLWPASDMAATMNSPLAFTLGGLALAKSKFLDTPDIRQTPVRTPTDFFKKHLSWDRILLASYMIAATTYPPFIAAGFLCFCAGYYMNAENDLNKSFVKDLKRTTISAQHSFRKLSL